MTLQWSLLLRVLRVMFAVMIVGLQLTLTMVSVVVVVSLSRQPGTRDVTSSSARTK